MFTNNDNKKNKLDPFHEVVPEKKEEKTFFSNMLNDWVVKLRDNLLEDESETEAEDKVVMAKALDNDLLNKEEGSEQAAAKAADIKQEFSKEETAGAISLGVDGPAVSASAATTEEELSEVEKMFLKDKPYGLNNVGEFVDLKKEKTVKIPVYSRIRFIKDSDKEAAQASANSETIKLPETPIPTVTLSEQVPTAGKQQGADNTLTAEQIKKRKRRYSLFVLLASAGVILLLLLTAALYKYFSAKELQANSQANLIKILQNALQNDDYEKFNSLFAANKAGSYDRESFENLRKNSSANYTLSDYVLVRLDNGSLFLVSIKDSTKEKGMYELESIRQIPPKAAGLFVNLSPSEEAAIVLPDNFPTTESTTQENATHVK